MYQSINVQYIQITAYCVVYRIKTFVSISLGDINNIMRTPLQNISSLGLKTAAPSTSNDGIFMSNIFDC